MIETVAGMRELVFELTREMDACLHHLARLQNEGEALPKGDTEVYRVVTTMIHMAGISGHSVLKLTDEISLGVKDAYPVARGIIEGLINVCFIMAGGVEIAKKAMRHAEVRSYRDLSRNWNAGGLQISAGYSGRLSETDIARLEAMLPEFTTSNGREKDWTDESIKQRLDAIAQKFPHSAMISLNASAFNIYRNASEVIHGSYYSGLYFWGLTIPGSHCRTKESVRLALVDHQFSVLMSVVFAYAGFLECLSDYANLPEFARSTSAILERLHNLPAVAEALATSAERQ